MNRILPTLVALLFLLPLGARAEEDERGHDHAKKPNAVEAKTGHTDHEDDDHGHAEKPKASGASEKHEGDSHGHDDDHEEEEGSAAVGPDKGILEANEANGFKLSAEALKNFGIKTVSASTSSMKLARSSIFFGLEERNLYRLRDGFFKRIDFKTISKSKTEYVVSSPDLKDGDQVAVTGLGFLRISELAAFGGVAEGHSH